MSSFFSESRSKGEWSNEQDGAMKILSEPIFSIAFLIKLKDWLKSFFQIFLPSTIPKDRLKVSGIVFKT